MICEPGKGVLSHDLLHVEEKRRRVKMARLQHFNRRLTYEVVMVLE